MSIFSRFSTMIKSNINDLISRAEDPEKMLNQIIIDMRDQLAKAKREVAGAIADERKLQRQLADANKERQAWEKRAMLAVQQGRDDLAKQALVRQQEHAEQAAQLEQTWQAQADETEKLKGSLRQLNEKIEEAKRKRNLLIAKQKRAQAQRRIHETMSGLSDTSAFEAFNRMAEKIEEEERRNLAQAEVNEALTGDTLETEFVRLESGSDAPGVDDKLLALKAKMGLIAAPEAEKPKQLGAGSGASGDGAADDDAGASGDSAEPPPIRDAELIEEFEKLEQGGGS
ncbi:MAG: PspA/IM30 family protein [Gemmatimonadetes bacterium]|nr:PspA/IM30 family protein [Gemmatimonadota bacterium]MDE2677842.1 PspA/IM30 family protein [Gemmatimonadota bacterium]MXX34281.1 PspA/IM30 family protein [Gemmatimonadota bacterium]MYA11828.1 PspA/IM30 family protein [Gemmatimonadota bacterium]MYD14499.1 PspA/IM30 family protein [Gemmatimonadota bacterium]